MKKIMLTVAIAFIAIVSAQAQGSVGIKAGVNFASILNENISGVKGRTSFHAGIVGEIETSLSTAVQIEILYSGQGFKYEGGIIEIEDVPKDTYKLNYLNIPILFKFYISEGFSFEIGPQVGFLLAANSDEGNVNVNKYFTTATFDALFGFGYKFENGFSLNARYDLGLTDIWKGPTVNPGYPYYYEYGRTNGVVQLGIGYYFE